MDLDIVSPFLLNVIIPFSTSMIITIIITNFHNKLKYNRKIEHEIEIKVFGVQKMLEEQIKKNNLLEEQIEIMLARTNQINILSNNLSSLTNSLNQIFINKSISQYSTPSNNHNHVSNSDINQSHVQISQDISQHSDPEIYNKNHRNSTIEYIIKKLDNNPLTTREIQKQIGRTREHTSRLLKKLYDNKIVERDTSSKPFKYTITNEGRKLLTKHYALKNHHQSDFPKDIESLSNELAMT